MNLHLDFSISKSDVTLEHGDSILLLGSCFSDNLAPKFEQSGFKTISNPLGPLFHPIALASALRDALDEKTDAKLVKRDDVYFDWRASSAIHGYSEQDLSKNISKALNVLKTAALESKVIVVTFGTAWGYYHETAGVVGNCHKQPQQLFKKQLADTEQIVSVWNTVIELVRSINPDVSFVFTVSPVRHLKDGLTENNRSKARLIQVCEKLEEQGTYFPSYEMVVDVLRDYRFYNKDLVHPSDQAIDYVWEHVQGFLMSDGTRKLAKRVEDIQRREAHVSLQPNSKATLKFKEDTRQMKESLLAQHPEVYWK